MRSYVIRRILLMIPTLFIVSIIIFFLIRLIPGSIIDAMVGQQQAFGIAEEMDRAAIERALGMDVPLATQYGRWIGVVPQADGSFSGILEGDFGNSMWKPTTVLEEVAFRWPITLQLAIMAFVIGQLIALPIGIFSALRQDTWGDYIARSFAIGCIAVPGFWVGTMIIIFPSIWWGYMPPITLTPFLEDPIGNLEMFILPAIVLGMAMGGMTMRMTRAMMLEVLRQDYIRTAWAKGLKERVVIVRHTLKNALIPVITVIGWQVPALIGGSVIIEQIFCLPGMGRLFLNAILLRDYTLVTGITLLFGIGMVFINLVVDITYAYLDPRIHFK